MILVCRNFLNFFSNYNQGLQHPLFHINTLKVPNLTRKHALIFLKNKKEWKNLRNSDYLNSSLQVDIWFASQSREDSVSAFSTIFSNNGLTGMYPEHSSTKTSA